MAKYREMHAWAACADGTPLPQPDRRALEQALAAPTGLLWLDVTAPREEDGALLQEVFGLHKLAVEDALEENERAKVESLDGYYSITFYAAAYSRAAGQIELRPLHLFIGRRFLVTVHGQSVEPVAATMRRWQAPDSPIEPRVGQVAYALIDALIDDYFPILDAIADEIDDLEDRIFVRGEADVIQTVFALKKDLLRLRRRVAPGRDVLNVLLRRELPIFDADDLPYLRDLYDHVVRLTENIDLYRDLLSSALDSHLSFQSNRLSQVVKALTVASIILMTNALIAGIYGMNFEHMPELAWRYGYPLALGLMATLSLVLVFFFRRRGWL